MAIWLFSWITALLCHRIITVSDYDLMRAQRMPFLRKKCIRIHNGIGKIKFLSKKESRESLLPDRAAATDKQLWVGMIAELHANKGIEHAIKAVKLLQKKSVDEKFILVIIGEGEERAALEKLIRELRLEHQVFLVGKKEQAPELLQAFNVFLLSSVKEGLPYVVLEAGLAELPVIATAVGGVPEIIKDMKSGILVKPRHEDEIALALDFLITNKNKCNEFGAALKEQATGNFSLKALVSQTSILYVGNDNLQDTR
jgi:glycosyltransferase involved in cell wall biosynthesis